jgi:hypothetical protein
MNLIRSFENVKTNVDPRPQICHESGFFFYHQMDSPMHLASIRVGNKYRFGRKIGSGSFGEIYLGISF